MSQVPNQFSQTPVKGQLDLAFNHNTISCVIKSDYSGAKIPSGTAVKLVDVDSKRIVVEPIAADTDKVFGFINYNMKDDGYEANDAVEVSGADNVMYMEAGAAIARGAEVMPVVTGAKVITATVGDKAIAGYALDKAGADEDLIRVVVFGRQSAFTAAA